MTDQEKRRQRAETMKRQKQRQRRAFIVTAVIFAAILAGLIFLAAKRLSEGPKTPDAGSAEETQTNQETAESSAGSEAETTPGESNEAVEDVTEQTEEEAAGAPAYLTFSEADTRAGDLILVNRTCAYDFEANEADLDLTNIREGQSFYYQVGNTSMAVAGRILGPLDQLVAACDQAVGTQQTGIESAQRSLEYQQRVWDEMEELYGREYCETYVAVPGHSEHHTGLAVDIGIFYPDGSEGSFSESENAVWMNANACHYGFVRRYAAEKAAITGYSNEAWHFRYVGIPHAVYMTQNNLCLEEYIEKLTAETSPAAPLAFEADGHTYEVYYTDQLTIERPEGEYTVSGSNTGGLIVTVKKS